MKSSEPKRGDWMICKNFWTDGGKSGPEGIARAGQELDDDRDADAFYVVQIMAVVRRKPGFQVDE